MRRLSLILVCLLGLGAAGLASPPPSTKADDNNQWRFKYHSGHWWYWLPENRWVYWRNGQWNDLTPPATASSDQGATASTRRRKSRTLSGAESDSVDIAPFYGRAESSIDRGPSRNEEIGPFYGHALPRDVFGSGLMPRFRRGLPDSRAPSSHAH